MHKPWNLVRVPEEVRLEVQGAARQLRTSPTCAEAALWSALRGKQLRGRRFRRQQPIGRFVVDFFCASEHLIIEVDGPIHQTKHEADQERQAVLQGLGYCVLRFSNDQVLDQIEQVLDAIAATFNAP